MIFVYLIFLVYVFCVYCICVYYKPQVYFLLVPECCQQRTLLCTCISTQFAISKHFLLILLFTHVIKEFESDNLASERETSIIVKEVMVKHFFFRQVFHKFLNVQGKKDFCFFFASLIWPTQFERWHYIASDQLHHCLGGCVILMMIQCTFHDTAVGFKYSMSCRSVSAWYYCMLLSVSGTEIGHEYLFMIKGNKSKWFSFHRDFTWTCVRES